MESNNSVVTRDRKFFLTHFVCYLLT